MTYTIGSLFSGIGGLDLAAHWAGFETSWFVEKEPFCQKVLAKHWPNIPIHDDVFTCKDLPPVDVIVGGFPCQPFSAAGARKGAADERYLLPEMLRIVREVQPYAVLFENVPGFAKLNHGDSFKYLLRTLTEMGFDAQWGHLFAKDAGAPHPRERWFCVAYTVKDGNGNGGRGRIDKNQEWHSSQTESEWNHKQSRPISYCEIMGNAASSRLYIPLKTDRRQDTTQASRGLDNRPERSSLDELGNPYSQYVNGRGFDTSGLFIQHAPYLSGSQHGQTQPRMARTVNGLPNRLDFVGFPARPGEAQYAYEPPRTAPSTKETNARIKALGNAVVPQVVFPIFLSLMEWLQELLQLTAEGVTI